MLPMKITARQIPILIAFAAVAVILFAYRNIFSGSGAVERAVREGSLPRLAAAVAAHPELVNAPDKENGFTPLHWAVMGNQTNLAEFLLSHGAVVNARDRDGLTPLHKAAAFNGKAMAEILLAAGADLNAMGTKYGVIQVAPLHLAAEAGFDEVIRVLLAHGAEINKPTGGENHATALHLAVAKGRSATVKMLLQAGAEVNPRDIKERTPLHWALSAEQSDCADILRLFGGTE